MIVTVTQRRAEAIERVRRASADVIEKLRTFADTEGGVFVVFGSAARGDLRPTSDFDVMVDFPAILERDARDFVEATCRDLGLEPDVHLASEVPDRLMLHVCRDGLVLP